MFGATSEEKAYIAPFLAFLGLLALGQLIAGVFDGQAFWMVAEPRYWLYPLQIVVCGMLLLRGWRYYQLAWPRGWAWTIGIGVLVLVLWIAPQEFFGAKRRLDGFDPSFFGENGPAYVANVTLRFIRLVVIVPLVEEIFWRGFLLRWLINPQFTKVPIGAWSWPSFLIVTAGFCLEHQMADWPAAALAGALYNLVAYRTQSLAACVLAHAITNALLGWYVLQTGQLGFW